MIEWRRVNDELFEYAVQRGGHGDEFVRLLDGSLLRRRLAPEVELFRAALQNIIETPRDSCGNCDCKQIAMEALGK